MADAVTEQVRLMGVCSVDPIGRALNISRPYNKFSSPVGCHGLARWTPDRLDILAISSRKEGVGQLRKFIAEAQKHWPTICVWFISNEVLDAALKRYGFFRQIELAGNGEVLDGLRWDKVP